MGHLITKDGLQMDPEKIRAITDFPEPQNLEELRRFLGMVNYLSRFLPSVTSEMHPLHNLLKKDVSWTWTQTQGESFKRIKEMIVNGPLLAFYDPGKDLTLEFDASE